MWFYWEIAIGCLNPIFRRAFLDNGSQLFAPRKATNMFNEKSSRIPVEIGAPDFWRWIADASPADKLSQSGSFSFSCRMLSSLSNRLSSVTLLGRTGASSQL